VSQIRRRLPDLRLDDIEFGVFGPSDGYANPREVLAGFRAGAAHTGAEYVHGEVTGIERSGGRVSAVTVRDGHGDHAIATTVVVNAAGAYAAAVGRLAGVELPVQPSRQHMFRCVLPRRLPYRFPMVIDPGGVHWRHDDDAPSGGDDAPDILRVTRSRLDEPAGENFTVDETRWTDEMLPALLYRVPSLAGLRLLEGWTGLYEMTPDHNAIIGEHPDVAGLFLANGFSGHGLMMAPATGQALSDLIRLGRSETIEIAPFAVDRFARGQPFLDEALI
jgi:glycine/D-amino acid oxidase-like deaminating enzyme